MFDVFLSHNSDDKEAVEALARRLESQEKLLPFLDRWHLVPGTPWQPAITQALEASKCVAVFIGRSGVSPWHNQELQLALTKAGRERDELRVIPVLLPGADEADMPGLLGLRTWVDFRGKEVTDDATFQRLVAGIRGIPPASCQGEFCLPEQPAPYVDLRPFDQANHQFFFGREREIEQALQKLEHSPCVALIGPSGSGKSSVALAGVVPRLGGRALILKPGADPLRTLAVQVALLQPQQSVDDLVARFRQSADGLRTALAAWTAGDRQERGVVVVDQLEELLTHAQGIGPDQQAFADNLLDLVKRGGERFKVLVTLRADFVSRALQVDALRELLHDSDVPLRPMARDDLRYAITNPAKSVGALFEAGLVNAIVKDVERDPGALPLLQHVLYQLWKERRGVWLTSAVYEELGGVSGALDKHASAVYARLSPKDQEIARRIFLRLTSLGEGVEDTRRKVPRAELYETGNLPEDVDRVLEHLSGPGARLLVVDQESVEVAHEVLLRRWEPLQQWVSQSREEARAQRALGVAARVWEGHARDPSDLFTGARLAQAEEKFGGAAAHGLNALELEFLQASLRQRDLHQVELEQRHLADLAQARRLAEEAEVRRSVAALRADDAARSSRRLGWALVASCALLLASTLSAVWAFALWQQVDGDNAALQRTVSACYGQRGGPRGMAEGLVRRDLRNAELQRDLTLVNVRLGDALREEGELTEAREAYRAALDMAERPEDVVRSCERLLDLAKEAGGGTSERAW